MQPSAEIDGEVFASVMEGLQSSGEMSLEGHNGGNGRGKNPHPVGRVTNAPKQYQIKFVWDNHREIVRRLALGEKHLIIAQEMGISRQTVTNVARSALTRARIDELHGRLDADTVTMSNRIRALAPLALAVSEEIMMSEEVSPAVKINVAQDLLDRAGYQPPKLVTVDHRFGISEEQKRQIAERAKQLGAGRGSVVEDAVFASVLENEGG